MNILFYLGITFDPLRGGIHRVTDVLMRGMSVKHKVSCLVLENKQNIVPSANCYYVPNQQDLYGEENRYFVKKLCRDLSIDIVINQEAISPYTSYFILDSLPDNVKVISVIHSSLTLIYSLKSKLPFSLLRFIPEPLTVLTDYFSFSYFRIKYFKQFKKMFNRSDKVVVLDKHLISDVSKFIGKRISPQKICVIANPITLVKTSYISVEKKKKQVLFVGRLSPEKNITQMLKIWSLLENDYPDWQLIIVGDGNMKKKVELVVKQLELQHISMVGKQEPTPYYREASIFMMTSLFEGLPLVLLEAMNFSVIPLAFDSFPAIQTIIDDKKTGFIIKPYDTQQYVKAMTTLMDSVEMRKSFSKQTYEKSHEFSLSSTLAVWDDLFISIMQNCQ